ncbi:MAG: gliding motility-associated C-terminal domain-containing protein, partial [Bacteroidales bacterium]|nr:gliding motility-associated C-terminal domain-containing protein [Bacteroidales bacterium]
VDWIESSDIDHYSLSVFEISEIGCKGDTVSVDIGFKDNSKVILLKGAPNAKICEGELLELIPEGGEFIEYEWNDGLSRAPTYLVWESGQYWVHVTNADGCQSVDTVIVRVMPLPKIEIGDTIQPCNETIELNAGNYKTNWSTGSIDQVIEIGEVDYDSLIWVNVTDNNNCSASDTLLVLPCSNPLDIPTAFTPNGDGFNDTWVIDGIERFENAEVRVYNRKKVLVFESTGKYEPWDGKAGNGRVLPVDSYHYVIDLKDPDLDIEQGFVTIVY